MVPSSIVLTGVALYNHLWEQDVGGSNPLAPTNIINHLDNLSPLRNYIVSDLCASPFRNLWHRLELLIEILFRMRLSSYSHSSLTPKFG